MKHLLILTVGICLLVSMPAMADGAKVLLIIKHVEKESADLELMLTKEVGVMTDMLDQAGFEVVVASASGQPLVAENTTLKPDLKLGEVKVADYAGFILPCMAVGEVPLLPEVAAIVKDALAEGKPVAAQFSSVMTIAKAGVLSGKKYSYFSEEWAGNRPEFKNAVFSGNDIVQDGNIITSGICPSLAKNQGQKDGTPNLTKAFIAALGDEK